MNEDTQPVSSSMVGLQANAVQNYIIPAFFPGIGRSNDNTKAPPDCNGAAGPFSVIQMVNTVIEARNTFGTVIFNSPFLDFFKTIRTVTYIFDPKIVFDMYSQKFVAVALEMDETDYQTTKEYASGVLLAMSKSNNPKSASSNDWIFKRIDAAIDNAAADYPGFAVDDKAIYVTANMYTMPWADNIYPAQASRVWVVDKNNLANYQTTTIPRNGIDIIYKPDENSYMPALIRSDGGAGTTTGTYLVGYDGRTNAQNINVISVVRINKPLTKNFSIDQKFIQIGNKPLDIAGKTYYLPGAPTLGGKVPLLTNDRRALAAAWHKNSLWMTTSIAIGGTTKALWIEIDTSKWDTLKVRQFGVIYGSEISKDTTTFMPSIAVNKDGVVAIGFSASSQKIYAGAYTVWRFPSDPFGQTRTAVIVKEGVAVYDRSSEGALNRWGDYSGVVVDPANESDNCFWITNQYAGIECGLAIFQGKCWNTYWIQLCVK